MTIEENSTMTDEDLSEEELSRMRFWFSLTINNKSTTQEYLSDNFHLRNFSFQDFYNIVVENKAERYWFSEDISVLLLFGYILIIVFGCSANGLICYTVQSRPKLRTVRNCYIVNLSISDIIMCIFCMPFTIVKFLLKNWILGDSMCRLVSWLQGVNVFVSTITIPVIALDRYQAIVRTSYKKENRRWMTVIAILMVWFVSVLISLPLIVYSRVEVKKYIPFVTYDMCLEHWPSNTARILYAAVIMLLQFIIPISTLITIHCRLCSFLKSRLLLNDQTMFLKGRALKEASRQRKNSALLMAIALSFGLCWFPLTVLNLLADLNYSIFMFPHSLWAFVASHMIAMTSACINPILYGWFNSNFRREIRNVISRACCQNVPVEHGRSTHRQSQTDKAQYQVLLRKTCEQGTPPAMTSNDTTYTPLTGSRTEWSILIISNTNIELNPQDYLL